MNQENLELELQKVGFDQREAKVYLAALELGPSPVQKIAQRAETPRATVYLVLDDLRDKGVITTYEEGKKTYYVAESPQQIAELVQENVLRAKQQQEILKDLIPELNSRGQFEKGTSSIVKYYQGYGGLRGYVHDIFNANADEILSFINHEESERIIAKADISWDEIAQKRSKKKVQRKLIVAGEQPEELRKVHKSGEARYVTKKQINIQADIDIIGDFVGFMPYTEPIRCVLIQDPSIAATLKELFSITWNTLK